jgi:hypothetical protein
VKREEGRGGGLATENAEIAEGGEERRGEERMEDEGEKVIWDDCAWGGASVHTSRGWRYAE